ncbi:MAG: AtpZ/AtpI family protein [Armatimonadetes bacterium]|nr:AtpZ/AtpI family protein [Armatimonadota bacterium]
MLLGTKEGRDASRALMQFSGLGCSLAAGVALFSGIGYALDQRFGTSPVWLAVLCLLGAGLSLYKVVRDVTRWSAEADRAGGEPERTDASS